MTSNRPDILSDHVPISDQLTWDPALDAVTVAPANHKVLFENDNLRVLEVTLAPDEEEPTHIITAGARFSCWTRCRDQSTISPPTGRNCRPIGMSSKPGMGWSGMPGR